MKNEIITGFRQLSQKFSCEVWRDWGEQKCIEKVLFELENHIKQKQSESPYLLHFDPYVLPPEYEKISHTMIVKTGCLLTLDNPVDAKCPEDLIYPDCQNFSQTDKTKKIFEIFLLEPMADRIKNWSDPTYFESPLAMPQVKVQQYQRKQLRDGPFIFDVVTLA